MLRNEWIFRKSIAAMLYGGSQLPLFVKQFEKKKKSAYAGTTLKNHKYL